MNWTWAPYLYVAMFSVLGTGLRGWISLQFNPARFPWGTLAVNTLGGFAIGAMFALRAQLNPVFVLALTVGGLGSLTTFSTFSIDTLSLLQQGRMVMGLANILANNFFAIGACYLGVQLVSRFA